MTTPTTPMVPPPATPPAASVPAAAPVPPPEQTRGASRVVAILTIALGIAVALGAIGSATFSTIAAAGVHTGSQTVDAAGVTALDVSVEAAAVRVEFGDVSEATLEVTSGGGVGAWVLQRDGDRLEVASPRRFGPTWLFFGQETRATLTLPRTIQGATLDAALELSAGDLIVDGDFGDLDIRIGAGSLTVDGSARTLVADLNAGGADIDLADVAEAEFTVSAGSLSARLTGAAPRTVSVDVNAGSLDLMLPDATYDVRSDVAAGELDNRLRTSSGARNSVDVSVSAGTVTLIGGR